MKLRTIFSLLYLGIMIYLLIFFFYPIYQESEATTIRIQNMVKEMHAQNVIDSIKLDKLKENSEKLNEKLGIHSDSSGTWVEEGNKRVYIEDNNGNLIIN